MKILNQNITHQLSKQAKYLNPVLWLAKCPTEKEMCKGDVVVWGEMKGVWL